MGKLDELAKLNRLPVSELTTPASQDTASQNPKSEVPTNPRPPKFDAGIGQPMAIGEIDSEGNLIGATQTVEGVSKEGARVQIIRTLTLPPFPQRNYVKMKVGNFPPFEMTVSGDTNTFTIKARNGQKGKAIVVNPRIGGVPEAWITKIDLDANDQITGTQQSNVHAIGDLKGVLESMLQEFSEYHDLEPIFRKVLKSAGEDLSAFLTPEALVQLDPFTGTPIVLYKLGWGTVGRAVVVGILAAGGAVAAAPAGAAVGVSALLGSFIFGFDAAIVNDILTAIEDGAGGPNEEKKNTEKGK
jgi:hypothetical protein